MDAIHIVKNFVEGALTASEFEKAIYSDTALEEVLSSYDSLPAYAKLEADNLYLYAIGQDFKNFGDLHKLQGVLSEFLSKNKIPFKRSEIYSKIAKLSLKMQPSWLLIPGDYFSFMLNEAGTREDDELKTWFKSEISKRFRYLKKPPKWLQSAAKWPISGNNPLVFVGQLDITDISHDNAQLYVFSNQTDGTFLTIKQSS